MSGDGRHLPAPKRGGVVCVCLSPYLEGSVGGAEPQEKGEAKMHPLISE